MMERVGVYVLYQNFCEPKSISHMKPATASSGTPAFKAIDRIYTDNSCYRYCTILYCNTVL